MPATPPVLAALSRAAKLLKSPETVDTGAVMDGRDSIQVLDTHANLGAVTQANTKRAAEDAAKTPPMEVLTKVLPDGRIIQTFKNVPEKSPQATVTERRAEPYANFAELFAQQQLGQVAADLDARDEEEAELLRQLDAFRALYGNFDAEAVEKRLGSFGDRYRLAREEGAGPLTALKQSAKIGLRLTSRQEVLRHLAQKDLNRKIEIAKAKTRVREEIGADPNDRRQLAADSRAGELQQIAVRNADDERLKSVMSFTDPANYAALDDYIETTQKFFGRPLDEHQKYMLKADYHGKQLKRSNEFLGIKMKIEDQELQRAAAARAAEDQELQRRREERVAAHQANTARIAEELAAGRMEERAARRQEREESENFKRTQSLTTKYDAQSKAYQSITDRLAQIESLAAMGTSAADIATLFAYMKALDSDSVVKESEYKTAASIGSIWTRLEQHIASAMTGQKLTPENRKAIADTIRTLRDALGKKHRDIQRYTVEKAKAFGVDPSLVGYDLGNVQTSAPAAADDDPLGIRRPK